jgi:hypothetical protein
VQREAGAPAAQVLGLAASNEGGQTVQSGSLARQAAFLKSLCAGTGVTISVLKEVSSAFNAPPGQHYASPADQAGAVAENHPLMRRLKSGGVQRGAVVCVTAVDRLSRRSGVLELLIREAQKRGVHIVAMLGTLPLLDSLGSCDAPEPPGYLQAALGTLAGALERGPAAHAALNAFNQAMQQHHRLLSGSRCSNHSPVVLPAALTASVLAQQWAKQEEKLAEQFVGGFTHGFRGAAPGTEAATTAGVEAATALAAGQQVAGTRGVTEDVLARIRAASEAALCHTQCEGGQSVVTLTGVESLGKSGAAYWWVMGSGGVVVMECWNACVGGRGWGGGGHVECAGLGQHC